MYCTIGLIFFLLVLIAIPIAMWCDFISVKDIKKILDWDETSDISDIALNVLLAALLIILAGLSFMLLWPLTVWVIIIGAIMYHKDKTVNKH